MSNEKQTPQVDISTMSAAQIQQILKEKQKEERKNKEANKAKYEKERNDLVFELVQDAIAISNAMKVLKNKAMLKLPAFRDKMIEYGALRKGEFNKGNFEIKTEHFKIEFKSAIVKKFDERADVAAARLTKFLDTTVKKRERDLHDLILSLMNKNENTGDYDVNLINRLYQMEDRFDNEDWKEAIRLFKESYSPYGTAYYARFFSKNDNNEWDNIILDFAKAKTTTINTNSNETSNNPA